MSKEYLDQDLFLYKLISSEYGKVLTEINNNSIVNQLVSVKVKNDGKKCNECLNVFISDPMNPNNDPEMTSLIDKLRGVDVKTQKINPAAICYDSCVTNTKLNITNNMNFKIGNMVNPSSENLEEIVEKIKDQITKEYKVESSDITGTIRKVINKLSTIDFSTRITINQAVSSYQLVNIEGPGIISANMKIVSDIIMKAIVDDDECLTIIDQMKANIISNIQATVNKNVVDNFTYIWNQLKTFLITTGLIFIGIFLLIIFMLFYRSYYSGYYHS